MSVDLQAPVASKPPPCGGSTEPQPASDLAQQFQELATIAGGLAHEIKNSLSTLRLNLDLLEEDFAEAPSPRERRALQKVRLLRRECGRLGDVLEDFLRFARPEQPRRERADLNALIEEVLDFYSPQAVQAGIDVNRYLDGDLPLVLADRDLIKNAILNLLLNAQQAMPDGGEILLRTTPRDGRAQLEVIDTGCGMDESTLKKIFQPFFSGRCGGSGLGLTTVKKIVQVHGGAIHVESEPGRGTRFTITLPAAPADGRPSTDDAK